MSNLGVIIVIVLSILALFLVIPAFVYIITKCFYDAKHKAKFDFLSTLKQCKGDKRNG